MYGNIKFCTYKLRLKCTIFIHVNAQAHRRPWNFEVGAKHVSIYI